MHRGSGWIANACIEDACCSDLKPVVEAIGIWGQRWFKADVSQQHLDPSLLM
ncbi:hypothetical protein [Mesorhizobium sp. WSM2239]|uniref:Transposase n=2 Tax=unclassified Mesorhizobium TaxID=325217 RepID=A0AAU8DKR5_9HYPH